jgi:hypothetical protein
MNRSFNKSYTTNSEMKEANDSVDNAKEPNEEAK